MSSNLSPNQFPYLHHAVQELAHGHPQWDGQHQPLQYSERSIGPSEVRFQRYPASDERVQSAMRGYTTGATMPPVVLVNRAGENLTADGHHRLSAAEILHRPVDAVVAHSPRNDAYRGTPSAMRALGTTKTRAK